MKLLGVVLGSMVWGACGGAPGDDLAADVGSIDATSSFELLRTAGDAAHRDHASGPAAVRRAIGAAADRLAALQADAIGDSAHNGLVDGDPDDGGWDFIVASSATEHTAAASPTNLFGAIGLAAWAAVAAGDAGNRALVMALDAGAAMQRDPDIDSAPDFVFGVLLAQLTDNPGFAEVARQHYDAKAAAAGGAAGLGALIRDARHASNEDGLIPYDLGWFVLGAAALDAAFPGAGYDRDADTYAGIVVDDLTAADPRFDIRDPSEGFYITGLAWSQIATAWLDQRAAFRQVRTLLLQEQRGDGAWGTGAAQPADDLQSTAHALQTLALTGRAAQPVERAMQRAARWLLQRQAASGGWPDGDIELPLVDADIALGVMLARTEAGEDGLIPGSLLAPRPHGPASSASHAAPRP